MSAAASPFRDGVQFAWDSTSFGLAMTCLRKYKYKMIDGWQPKGKSVHLWFGGLYASALEDYFKYTATGTEPEAALRKVIHEALIESWDHERDEEGKRIEGTGEPVAYPHNSKTRENLIRTIVWYFAHFEKESAPPIILSDGTPAVEYSFKLDVGDGLVYSGHLDRLSEYQGEPYVMDQKTTGMALGGKYFEQFETSAQMSGYTFAGTMILGTPVKGVIIDAAQVLVGHTKFERGFTNRTAAQLDEWLETFHTWVGNVHRAAEMENYPMNLSSCGNYGGCEFARICGKSPRMREVFLQADFEKKPIWNPLESR